MIYFLVNNNFHLLDAEENIKHLQDQPIGLIKIPHKLTISPKFNFDIELEFPPLIRSLIDHFRFLRIAHIHKSVKKQLKNILSTDVLIIYTEYEYLTHYVVKLFKKKNAKIVLIEEGLLTYETFTSTPNPSALSLKKRILEFYLKLALGYRATNIVPINNMYCTQINDDQIDKLLTYKYINVKRKVSLGLLTPEQIKYKNLQDNTAFFLNEPLYNEYISMEEYSIILHDTLANLSNYFDRIYFKFHPRELQTAKNHLQLILQDYPKVILVHDTRPAELMIDEIGAKYIVSFIAHTLLYLSNSNCISVYILQLYPKLLKHAPLATVKRILIAMNYKLLNNWSEIKNKEIGFSQNKNNNVQNLQYHLDKLLEHSTN